ncbi:hypothetical protein FOPG_05570 [Fusarium oxysporum f. sp. conglutinans race 2 54008]|uniref:Major facilitator superfamily (MFS) profile domain-containing protein n=1 Tax=Fusarium oxysporum f. sp. conglutinans race 2 54008 TaxID=1089457 RepID=X0HXP6_FUSOX|nr:hypothetical protein FOPG_05570 [Fusarium oxysporum f. sp. conglutinans race 2 54008]
MNEPCSTNTSDRREASSSLDGQPDGFTEHEVDNNPNLPLLNSHRHPSAAGSTLLPQGNTIDDEVANKVLAKIDRAIIPLLFITYMLNFMDKVILSSAAVFGLREDTNLKGQQYSWVGSVFYLGYLLWTYPTTVLVARLPTGKYLTVNTLFWGLVVALTAACHNFGGLLVMRFLLGVAEATITPGFMFLTSTWYTRDEMPTRVGIWFSGNSVGGLVASLLAFAIGHVHGASIRPWRWMYIILGTTTFMWAIPLFFLLPDNISKAAFLTPKERRIAAQRVVSSGTGTTEHTNWKWDQVHSKWRVTKLREYCGRIFRIHEFAIHTHQHTLLTSISRYHIRKRIPGWPIPHAELHSDRRCHHAMCHWQWNHLQTRQCASRHPSFRLLPSLERICSHASQHGPSTIELSRGY